MSDQLTLEDAIDAPGTYCVTSSCPNGGCASRETSSSRQAALDKFRAGVERRWKHFPEDIARMKYTAELVEPANHMEIT